ncbi:MAG: class I SAM-dependent methyltransferase [Polyangiales bacterium]
MKAVKLEDRFTEVADLYDRHRPGYPDAVVDWLVREGILPLGAGVLDVGCGTGISARLFAKHGFEVTAIDPNESMLEKARAHGGGPTYVRGGAEATGLPEGSFDFAYAAQAFHWFDLDATFRELARVLRPGSWAAAFWNLRAATPAMDAYEALLRERSHEYQSLERPQVTIDRIRARFPEAREMTFDNGQRFDWESFHGRVHSSSYVAHGVADPVGFDAALRALFDRYAEGGRLLFAYEVKLIAFRLQP